MKKIFRIEVSMESYDDNLSNGNSDAWERPRADELPQPRQEPSRRNELRSRRVRRRWGRRVFLVVAALVMVAVMTRGDGTWAEIVVGCVGEFAKTAFSSFLESLL